MLLGYSAAAQGRLDDAERRFDEVISVTVPARTHSPNRPIEARAAFRRGERTRAFRLLRAHVDELLDTGNMQAASVTGVEFVTMMAAMDRLPAAAVALGYLDTTGCSTPPRSRPSWLTPRTSSQRTPIAWRTAPAGGTSTTDRRSGTCATSSTDSSARRRPVSRIATLGSGR